MTQPELTAAPLQDHALLCLAADWQAQGHQLAVAIVISTWGLITPSGGLADAC